MGALRDVLGEAAQLLREFAVGTMRTTAALWPQLLGLALLGWLAPELALKAALLMPIDRPYLVLAVFSLGFLGTLVCTVLMIRMTTTHAARRRADGVAPRDGRGATQVLASTLLPFLGMYAAFDHVKDQARELSNQSIAKGGIFEGTLLSHLDPFTSPRKTVLVLLLIVGLYVVRRLVDLAHDRTGWRPLGFLVVVLESYFLLVVLMAGKQFLAQAAIWWHGRRQQQWLDGPWRALVDALRSLHIDLPAVILAAGRLLGQVVPMLLEVLAEPLIWLAIAALVMGSRMLELSDVVRVGRRSREHRGTPSWLGRGWGEFRRAFLGDIDDKYLPTVHALAMLLRAGLVLLGTYVLAWTVLRAAGNLWEKLVFDLVGGHRYIDFWVVNQPWVTLLSNVPVEMLRAALLGVAFTVCTEQLGRHQRSRTVEAPDAASPEVTR